jgi:flavin-dependent dehydrogenase
MFFVSSIVMNYENLMLTGAGINGSWAALQLARRGAKVILLEKVHFISTFKIVSFLLSVVFLSEFLVPSRRRFISLQK